MSAPRGVVASAKLIALGTLLSRVTGLARDILLARAFGLGWIQDAFSYAFQIPNLFRRLFGEGAMSPVFVPVFSVVLEREGPASAWRLLARTVALLTVALVVLVGLALMIVGALWSFPPADPFRAEARSLLLSLTAIMLPFMLTICLVALLSSVLNCLGSFVPAALVSVVLNVVMILGIAIVAPRLFPDSRYQQVFVVAGSVLVAGVLQLVFLIPPLRRRGVPLRWDLNLHDPHVRRMLQLLVPVALGQGLLSFGVFLDATLCAWLTRIHGGPEVFRIFTVTVSYPLQEGALSALTYAQRLYQFPLGVLVLSLATAALPAFSRLAARGEWLAWTAEVRQSLRLAVFEGIAAGTMMIVLAEPITRLLFEYGRFSPADTRRVAAVVVWYGLALWAYCGQHIVQRGFYSLGDARTPLIISAYVLPANLILTLALVWLPALRESAFAISSAITSGAAVVAGAAVLQARTHQPVFARRDAAAVGWMLLCGAVAGVVALLAKDPWGRLAALVPLEIAERVIETLGLLSLGTAVFLLSAKIAHLPEVDLLLPRRLRAARPAPPTTRD